MHSPRTSPHPSPATDRARPLPALVAWCGIAALTVGVLGAGSALRLALAVLLVVYVTLFVRHFGFAIAALRGVPHDLRTVLPTDPHRPTVSVLVACHDEVLVADGLVRALRSIDYPSDRIEFVLVDDGSLDGTARALTAAVDGDPRCTVLCRPPGSPGGKSGALNDALARVRGDVVVVFDADHRPRPDAVTALVALLEDPDVAAVQGRCVIRNPGESVVSGVVAADYQAGYLVNEYGRQAVFGLPAYGGANCAVRTSVLRAVGGWNERSVTEDTDLTLRLVLLGHRVRYAVTAIDTEEAVTSLRRYWNQRYRWARGHQACWRDYRSAVRRSPVLSRVQKAETTLFLLAFHLPALSLVGLGLAVAGMLGGTTVPLPAAVLALWTLLFVGPLVELAAGMVLAGAPRRDALRLFWFVPLYVVSMVLCTKALVDGLLGRDYRWVKTPRSQRSQRTRRTLAPVSGVAA